MKYFKLYELVDRRTFETEGEEAWLHFDTNALIALDDLRSFFGLPITVNTWHSGGAFQYRGYRPQDCTVGVKGSYHRKGMAFDLDVSTYRAEEVRKIIIENKNNPLLSKITRIEAGVTWIHFDIAPLLASQGRIYEFHA